MLGVFQALVGGLLCVAQATGIGASDRKLLNKATDFLGTPKKVSQLQIEKTVVYDLLDKTVKSKGEIYLGKGKFRWETSEPEKTLLIFDGKNLWTQQTPAKPEDGKIQVTKSTLKGSAKDQVLIKLLSGGGKFSSKFKINSVEKKPENQVIFDLQPAKVDPTIKKFQLTVDKKKSILKEIAYTDEVGNRTSIQILDRTVIKKPDAKLFQFEKPAGAEVNEL